MPKPDATDILILAGIAAASGGLFMLAPWLGVTVLGLLLIGLGVGYARIAGAR